MACITKNFHEKSRDVLTHPCYKLHGGLVLCWGIDYWFHEQNNVDVRTYLCIPRSCSLSIVILRNESTALSA